MKPIQINVLFEDNELIVCEKPAGIPSQSDKTGDYDMVNRLKNYLFQKKPEGGEPYIGVIHRLDRPVGGIMLFAKTPFAAKKLSESVRNGDMRKWYLAVLSYDGRAELGEEPMLLTNYLAKDGRTNLSQITDEKDRNGKKAELYYQIKEVNESCSLAEIRLLTGRHHQIRVQTAAHLGGIWGDTKYNPLFQQRDGFFHMGLFAYRLAITHPRSGKELAFKLFPQGQPFDMFSPFS